MLFRSHRGSITCSSTSVALHGLAVMPCEGRTLDATLAEAAEPSEDSRRSATERFAVPAFPTGEVTKTPSTTDRFAVAASLTGEVGRKGNAGNTRDCKTGDEVEDDEERPRARGVSVGKVDTRAERFRAMEGVGSEDMVSVGGTASVGRTAGAGTSTIS